MTKAHTLNSLLDFRKSVSTWLPNPVSVKENRVSLSSQLALNL